MSAGVPLLPTPAVGSLSASLTTSTPALSLSMLALAISLGDAEEALMVVVGTLAVSPEAAT